MFENESEFQKLVDRLRIDTEPNPAHREKLRRQMLTTFQKAVKQSVPESTVFHWGGTKFLSVPITRLAVAAVVAVAVFIGIYKFWYQTGETSVALAKIVQTTEKMPWMCIVIKEHYEGKEVVEQQWCCFASKMTFRVSSSGTIWCLDYGIEQKEFCYQPATKTLTISDLPKAGLFGTDYAYNLPDVIRVYDADKDKPIRQYSEQFEDKQAKVYEIEKARPGFAVYGKMSSKLKLKILADATTNLILSGVVEILDDGNSLIGRTECNVSYPQTGPRDIYDLGVPRTARIIDRTTGPIGTPGNEPTPVPTPAPQ